ncbi:hypothetical protein LSAT2_009185 [Lamellibrachia satsuma]|nr:hypothetical protein LSAT2_009185 [Lamellibrachia satsuma]
MAGAMRCPTLFCGVFLLAATALASSATRQRQPCRCLPTQWEGVLQSRRRILNMSTGKWQISDHVWTMHYDYGQNKLVAMLSTDGEKKIIADSSKGITYMLNEAGCHAIPTGVKPERKCEPDSLDDVKYFNLTNGRAVVRWQHMGPVNTTTRTTVALDNCMPVAQDVYSTYRGRSTIEQIFNLRILCEKHLQHQQSLYHVFIDFKKAFDKVWHAALWATMKKYNIGSKLVRTIEHLYDNATSAVTFNSSIGDWFRTTVGVRQGCLLSPTLFNIFLERIMTDALENHQGTVSIGGRTITNLRFADDIDGLAGDEQELVNLVEHLEKTSSSYGMEISAEKTKLMTNSTQGISTEVKVNGQRLEAVTSFRYLGSIITDEGSKPEILARIAQTTAALTRLKPLWNDRNITVSSKIRLMHSLVMSIFLYACETWTLSADLQKRIQAMEMRCFRKILHISYKDHVTNDAVRNKIKQAIGPYDDLLTTVKKRKLKWWPCKDCLARYRKRGQTKR